VLKFDVQGSGLNSGTTLGCVTGGFSAAVGNGIFEARDAVNVR
jgi:hypothetical protein